MVRKSPAKSVAIATGNRRTSLQPAGKSNTTAAWALVEPRIGFLLLPKFSMLELFCAIEPLRIANRLGGQVFSWTFISTDGAAVAASNGIPVAPSQSLQEIKDLPILFVTASFEPEVTIQRRDQAKLRDLARHGTLLGAIDTGPFVLARAGLLQNRRTTLHWESLAAFAEEFPEIPTSANVFELDGDRLTCPGGTAPIDMMLHLIALRGGSDLANAIAEQIVHPRIRPGHDPQRQEPSQRYQISDPTVIKAIALMEDNLDEPLGMEEVAHRCDVSQRHLERLFRTCMNQTGKALYVRLRLDRARQLLVETHRPIGDIALATGFASRAHFTRAYRGIFGTTPGRRRRQVAGNPSAAGVSAEFPTLKE
ncbi:MAG TPA: GlxA family transcriptional regulator [Dongiaceae bacterium]